MRILMILVSDTANLDGAPPVLQFERFLEPYYLFVDSGADVVLASLLGGDPSMRTASGKRTDASPAMRRFQRDLAARDALADTLELSRVDLDDFDGAFCVGVSGGVWPPHVASPAEAMIGDLLAAGKPVVVVPARIDLEPRGTADGLLITGDRALAPMLAARALLGALTGRVSD
jgi:hypothetical protein